MRLSRDSVGQIFCYNIAKAILGQYNCKNVEDMQDAIKDIFDPMFEAMLQGEMETKNLAVYVSLGYDVNGVKDILGLWIGEAEGKHYWMQIFDEIKVRGVEDMPLTAEGISGPPFWRRRFTQLKSTRLNVML